MEKSDGVRALVYLSWSGKALLIREHWSRALKEGGGLSGGGRRHSEHKCLEKAHAWSNRSAVHRPAGSEHGELEEVMGAE